MLIPSTLFAFISFITSLHIRAKYVHYLFLFLTWISLIFVLGFMWISENRPPFKTFYETYILLSFSLMSIGFFSSVFSHKIIYGMVSSFLTFCISSYAMLNPDIAQISLPPALRSPWFVPHVLVYFLGYGFTFIAGAFAVLSFIQKDRTAYDRIDHCLRSAFFLLTIGISFGSLWADEAWGTYWGWDPKESWALVSVLSVAAYCHLPKTLRHQPTGLLWAIGCTGLILFTYLGIHILPTATLSVHTYTQ